MKKSKIPHEDRDESAIFKRQSLRAIERRKMMSKFVHMNNGHNSNSAVYCRNHRLHNRLKNLSS